MFDFDELDAVEDSADGANDGGEGPQKMTFYAISDVHIEIADNMQWVKNLPKVEQSTVIVAGDLGITISSLREALSCFKEKFDNVFYCYGNHECWCMAENDQTRPSDSFQKLKAIRSMCRSLGVFTTPQLIEGVWVVPVLGWYHSSWDTEGPLRAPPGKKLERQPKDPKSIASDAMLCNWGALESCSAELASVLDEQNEIWGVWPLPPELLKDLEMPKGQRKHFVLSFSHFLPRMELMPEKRFLFQPNLIKIVGSDFVRRRVETLNPDLHVFGHSHFPWDMTLDDGVRYRSWPLGKPDEQARRIASYPTLHTEQWYPLPVFDSNGQHYPKLEVCWFSEMYTRIPREPESCHMAEYVANIYCPGAPLVDSDIISPGLSRTPASAADLERRNKYLPRSFGSMKSNVATWKRSQS